MELEHADTRLHQIGVGADSVAAPLDWQEDGLSVFDLENAVLTGEIVERQRDRRRREWKYVVNGKSLDGDTVGVVGKLSPTGCLVIITLYRVQP